MTTGDRPSPFPPEPDEPARRKLRRVVIEERQAKTIAHARLRAGFDDNVSPHAHDRATFRLIVQRKQLDELPGADYIVPSLDEWKHWTKMGDWDSRNRLLEELIGKMRRREASRPEIEFLLVVCRPAWAGVARDLRKYGGLDSDPNADGAARREEIARVNELDRHELDQIIQDALMQLLTRCPSPTPHHFFRWLKATLAHRALDFIRDDLGERPAQLPHDTNIKQVLDELLSQRQGPGASIFASPGSPKHAEWLRTLDLPAMFELAHEYATYARTETVCERAVGRLPRRQRDVIRRRYYQAMTQESIARHQGVTASTVRSSHERGLRNLRKDDELCEVLTAIGKVRGLDRQRDVGKAA